MSRVAALSSKTRARMVSRSRRFTVCAHVPGLLLRMRGGRIPSAVTGAHGTFATSSRIAPRRRRWLSFDDREWRA